MGNPAEPNPWDPREDPGESTHHYGPLTPDPDEWISWEAVTEIISFELMAVGDESICPRCGATAFTYGRIRFCSRVCPENLLVRENEARLE